MEQFCHKLLLLTASWFFSTTTEAQTTNQPNILFIVADDLGWTDINAYDPLHRNYYETPNLDKLTRDGVKFIQAYANPTCTPSRAALFSGQYYPNQPVYDVGTPASGKLNPAPNTDVLPSEKFIISEALKQAGYYNAFMGKWHIGHPGKTGPMEQGFDINIGGYHAGNPGRWLDGYFGPNNNEYISDAKENEFLTDYLSRKAVEFIEGYDKTQPFYLHLSYFAVHVPLQAPEGLIDKYRKKQGKGGHDNPTYAAMIELLDLGVGRVLKALDDTGHSDNTLVIFYSDNGGRGGYSEPEFQNESRDITNNAPLRSGKASFYEGGIRVPLILRWPGHIAPHSLCTKPVIHVDFYPTLLELAGITQPQTYSLDGESFTHYLMNSELYHPERNLYWHFPGYTEVGIEKGPQSVIRTGDWKLFHFYEDDHTELYNLVQDPSESIDVSNNEPIMRDSLRQSLESWLSKTNAPMPQPKDSGIYPKPKTSKPASNSDQTIPRLFVIGDSISIYYGNYLEEYLQGIATYKRKENTPPELLKRSDLVVPSTKPNGGDSRLLLAYLRHRRIQDPIKADVLLLNCGLHDLRTNSADGTKQVPLIDYERNLNLILNEAHQVGLKVIWIRTTPVIDSIHNGRLTDSGYQRFAFDVNQYNDVADQVMRNHGVPIIDLHGFTQKFIPEGFIDHVHFTEDVRQKQAAFIAGALESLLPEGSPKAEH